MSTERPARGLLVFQCDVCFDAHEFSTAEGADVRDFHACWRTLRDDGWSMNGTLHFCPDCTATAKSDRDNPFKR